MFNQQQQPVYRSAPQVGGETPQFSQSRGGGFFTNSENIKAGGQSNEQQQQPLESSRFGKLRQSNKIFQPLQTTRDPMVTTISGTDGKAFKFQNSPQESRQINSEMADRERPRPSYEINAQIGESSSIPSTQKTKKIEFIPNTERNLQGNNNTIKVNPENMSVFTGRITQSNNMYNINITDDSYFKENQESIPPSLSQQKSPYIKKTDDNANGIRKSRGIFQNSPETRVQQNQPQISITQTLLPPNQDNILRISQDSSRSQNQSRFKFERPSTNTRVQIQQQSPPSPLPQQVVDRRTQGSQQVEVGEYQKMLNDDKMSLLDEKGVSFETADQWYMRLSQRMDEIIEIELTRIQEMEIQKQQKKGLEDKLKNLKMILVDYKDGLVLIDQNNYDAEKINGDARNMITNCSLKLGELNKELSQLRRLRDKLQNGNNLLRQVEKDEIMTNENIMQYISKLTDKLNSELNQYLVNFEQSRNDFVHELKSKKAGRVNKFEEKQFSLLVNCKGFVNQFKYVLDNYHQKFNLALSRVYTLILEFYQDFHRDFMEFFENIESSQRWVSDLTKIYENTDKKLQMIQKQEKQVQMGFTKEIPTEDAFKRLIENTKQEILKVETELKDYGKQISILRNQNFHTYFLRARYNEAEKAEEKVVDVLQECQNLQEKLEDLEQLKYIIIRRDKVVNDCYQLRKEYDEVKDLSTQVEKNTEILKNTVHQMNIAIGRIRAIEKELVELGSRNNFYLNLVPKWIETLKKIVERNFYMVRSIVEKLVSGAERANSICDNVNNRKLLLQQFVQKIDVNQYTFTDYGVFKELFESYAQISEGFEDDESQLNDCSKRQYKDKEVQRRIQLAQQNLEYIKQQKVVLDGLSNISRYICIDTLVKDYMNILNVKKQGINSDIINMFQSNCKSKLKKESEILNNGIVQYTLKQQALQLSSQLKQLGINCRDHALALLSTLDSLMGYLEKENQEDLNVEIISNSDTDVLRVLDAKIDVKYKEFKVGLIQKIKSDIVIEGLQQLKDMIKGMNKNVEDTETEIDEIKASIRDKLFDWQTDLEFAVTRTAQVKGKLENDKKIIEGKYERDEIYGKFVQMVQETSDDRNKIFDRIATLESIIALSNIFTKNNLSKNVKKLSSFSSTDQQLANQLWDLRNFVQNLMSSQNPLIGEFETDCNFKSDQVQLILKDTLLPLLLFRPETKEFQDAQANLDQLTEVKDQVIKREIELSLESLRVKSYYDYFVIKFQEFLLDNQSYDNFGEIVIPQQLISYRRYITKFKQLIEKSISLKKFLRNLQIDQENLVQSVQLNIKGYTDILLGFLVEMNQEEGKETGKHIEGLKEDIKRYMSSLTNYFFVQIGNLINQVTQSKWNKTYDTTFSNQAFIKKVRVSQQFSNQVVNAVYNVVEILKKISSDIREYIGSPEKLKASQNEFRIILNEHDLKILFKVPVQLYEVVSLWNIYSTQELRKIHCGNQNTDLRNLLNSSSLLNHISDNIQKVVFGDVIELEQRNLNINM